MKNKILNAIFAITLISGCSFYKPLKEKIMPGHASKSLSDLSPGFERKVKKLISKMEDMGYDVRISQTYRDKERQNFLHHFSEVMKEVTGQEIKITATTKSRHSHTHDGKPAACAIDIRPTFTYMPKSQVDFYKTLRDEAKKLGLYSGADFKRTTFFHKQYDIGWDPGHIYSKKC